MTILLLDDHTLFRQGIAQAVAAERGFQVLHCGSPDEAFALLQRHRVDVVLLDYDLGSSNGLAFIHRAKLEGLSSPILMLTAGLNMSQARQVLDAGVAGIFLKDQSISSLIAVVELVARGERMIDPRFYEAMLLPHTPATLPLTQREYDILNAVVEGLTNKEIAASFAMSETAVKSTVQRLFFKTGTRNRTQLLRFALERL